MQLSASLFYSQREQLELPTIVCNCLQLLSLIFIASQYLKKGVPSGALLK